MLLLPLSRKDSPLAGVRVALTVVGTTGTGTFQVPDGRWALIAAALSDDAAPFSQFAMAFGRVTGPSNAQIGPTNGDNIGIGTDDWSPCPQYPLQSGTTYTLTLNGLQTTAASCNLLLQGTAPSC